jgi:RnfABCDGE-type electron transport complex B subunit
MKMSMVLMATLSMGGLAAFFAFMLSLAHRRLKVEEDPRVEKILDALPGVNCGACGFASCHALAEAIVKEKAKVNACVVGGPSCLQKISEIMGVEWSNYLSASKESYLPGCFKLSGSKPAYGSRYCLPVWMSGVWRL